MSVLTEETPTRTHRTHRHRAHATNSIHFTHHPPRNTPPNTLRFTHHSTPHTDHPEHVYTPHTDTTTQQTDTDRQCQMQLFFVARLEPTRMRRKSDQVCTTVLKAKETDVQECHSAKSTCNSTLHLSLGWLCAQADYDAHRC